MSDKYFIDTNIFVYSFDAKSKLKQKQSKEIIDRAIAEHNGIISFQVIQEFINVATHKFPVSFSTSECRLYLEQVLSHLCEVYPTIGLYQQALTIQSETGFSFYDSLIVAAAQTGGCKIIYSEDLQHGQILSGLTIQNPFMQD